MDDSHALPAQVTEALARGGIVLTANQRAARTLRRAFDLRQRSLGLSAWEPPSILAWDSWLESLWYRLLLEGHASDLLLSPTQEHTVWSALIAADATTSSLRPIDALAETAADAFHLLHDYRVRHRLHSSVTNSDTRAFDRWAAEFDRRCARTHYLTQAQLPEFLRTAISADHLTLPPELLLVGFDFRSPAQTALLDTIHATGTTIAELTQSPSAPSLALAPAPDESTELAACARWLRAYLTGQPDATIAVIVPNIEPERAEIDRVFRNILAPELNDIAVPANSGPYEFSLGASLAHTPIVATALDILHWFTAPLPLDRVSALLRSPHFAAGAQAGPERLARAEFDAFVLCSQHMLVPQLSLDALYDLTSNSRNNSASLPLLNEHLKNLKPRLRREDFAADRTHAEWAATMHDLLEEAGWAIPANLDSIEFQTRRKWDSALDELATLDFENARVAYRTALAAIERIAAKTLFAPQSRHAPIQIMGPLESAGSSFDAVWFLRANDSAWPAPSAPSPLLPWPLQHELAMPGADPPLDAARSRRMTERIAASAPTVLFSYALQSADGPQRPSPMLSILNIESLATAPTQATPPRIELEPSDDIDTLPPPPDSVLRGGASILQAQAACGFKAFAEKRLFSSTPDTISLGLDARERGNLVHKVLELFWNDVQNHAALVAMPRAARDTRLTHSINSALHAQNRHVDPGWPLAYFDTERERLFRLLNEWLDLEAARPPFAVKAREEPRQNVLIGPLHLDVRVDRVDVHLVDGEPAGEIILDYKTGSASPAEWLGDRPDQPQLPLYAVLSQPDEIAAIAFAVLRRGKKTFGLKGYEAQSGILTKASKIKADSLDTQIGKWQQVLTRLAEDFHAGDARVAPKQYPSTCRYCDQRLLCRLDVAALDANVNEDFVADSDPTVDSLDVSESDSEEAESA